MFSRLILLASIVAVNLIRVQGNGTNDVETCSCKEFKQQSKGCPSKEYKAEKAIGACIYISTRKASWEEAKEDCRQRKGHLLTIKDKKRSDGLKTVKRLRPLGIFWIGMTDSTSEGTYKWVTGEKAKWFNWDKPTSSQTEFEDCIGRLPSGKWNNYFCAEKFSHVCESTGAHRLEPPRLEVKFDEPSKELVYGRHNLTATCQGFVGNKGQIIFKVKRKTDKKEKTYDLAHHEVIYFEDREYVKDENGCGRRSKASFVTLATQAMAEANVRCCVQQTEDQQQLCSAVVNIAVKYPDRQPNLTVVFANPPSTVFHGSTVTAHCAVATGDGGYVEWRLNRTDGQSKYTRLSVTKESKKWTGDTSDLVTTNTKWIYDDTVGSIVESTFNMKITMADDGSQIICATKTTSTESAALSVIYLPQTPELVVAFPGRRPWLINHKEVSLRCSAHVGSVGILTWELTTLTRVMRWSYKQYDVVEVSKARTVQVNHDLMSDENSELGPYLESEFVTEVDSELEGAKITCRTHLPQGVDDSTIAYPLHRDSLYFRIVYSRQKPHQTVGYHGRPPYVYLYKIVRVTCSAFVGTGGVLTVGLLSAHNVSALWSHNVSGGTHGGHHDGLYVWHNPVVKDPENGPQVTIELKIMVTLEHHNAIVACYSHNVSNLTEAVKDRKDEFGVTSLRFQVKEAPKLEGEWLERGFDGDMPFFDETGKAYVVAVSSVVLLLVVFFGVATMVVLSEKDNDEQGSTGAAGKSHSKARERASRTEDDTENTVDTLKTSGTELSRKTTISVIDEVEEKESKEEMKDPV